MTDAEKLFQSTRPVWGATMCRQTKSLQPKNFNPRAPCGARQTTVPPSQRLFLISIHAPRVGRDPDRRAEVGDWNVFQSTRPVWGATIVTVLPDTTDAISIHAPRVGRDFLRLNDISRALISIHAPRVGRDSKFDDFTPSNLHKRYKRVLARPKNTREKGKIKQKLAYIHAFSAFLGCEGSGTFCALVLRTQYR